MKKLDECNLRETFEKLQYDVAPHDLEFVDTFLVVDTVPQRVMILKFNHKEIQLSWNPEGLQSSIDNNEIQLLNKLSETELYLQIRNDLFKQLQSK